MTQLPVQFQTWLNRREWRLHPHQEHLVATADLPAQLLIAPTGAGKTLSGFLPSLIELAQDDHAGLHTIYVSPLKALATDIKRNLATPITEMALPITVEDRTGDTSQATKRRQRAAPPNILLTTPESLALLLSYPDAVRMFANLQRVVIDEIHALADTKRGDQLALALSRLSQCAPHMRRVGLSATVDDPKSIAKFLAPADVDCPIHMADSGPTPDISMLQSHAPPPWTGAGATYAIPDVLREIRQHKTTLIFHNTRAQAEIFFHNLWLANTDNLPIAIHHGSLDRDQRQRVEQAMVQGQLRAIVCTGSLDLGIDWGDVDLVVQIGAPKNVKRLVQRIGRANHRYNAPSKAIIVPANKFEIIECHAALQAVIENDLDGDPRPSGPLDVLCQHILLCACAGPIHPDHLYHEIKSAGPYAQISRAAFDDCLDFCTTGGYALKRYDQWHRLRRVQDGTYVLRDPRSANRIRMNSGTIQDSDTLKVRLNKSRGGRPLGEIEESFAATLTPGDTFLIGGQVVRFESLRDMVVQVSRDARKRPKIATFMGTKFATSTQLCERILTLFETQNWSHLPRDTQTWLQKQNELSALPTRDSLLVETFERQGRHHICVFGFAGRNAQQTLGLLITHRLEQLGKAPIGFVTNDYGTLIWGLDEITDPAPLFDPADIQTGFDTWLSTNAVMKRSFRGVATIAGLIERNLPGLRKTGRQATFSSDILYDTLQKYDPDHLLLRVAKQDALSGLVDFGRIEQMLNRVQDRIVHNALPHVSPFAAPLFLEAGRISVGGEAMERLIDEEAKKLFQEAGLSQ